MIEDRELFKEIYSLVESGGVEQGEERIRDLNYRLRKFTEELIVRLGRENVHTPKAVNIYIRLGDNYSLLYMNSRKALENLISSARELKELMELTEGIV